MKPSLPGRFLIVGPVLAEENKCFGEQLGFY